jgi:hypothetical protein
VSAEPRLEIADIHLSHTLIIANMTNLVISYSSDRECGDITAVRGNFRGERASNLELA